MANPFTTSLRAFHGDPAIKARYLARVEAHVAADELIHGIYWESGKGCAVGCTIHGDDHAQYETELGIPRILARLEDRLFESMANWDAHAWPTLFLSSIPVGADLSLVWPRFAVWMLVDATDGVMQYARGERSRAAIQRVADLYQRIVDGEPVTGDEFANARSVAYADGVAVAAYAASAASADAYAASAASASADATAAAASADAADDADADAYVATYVASAAAAVARPRFALRAGQRLAVLMSEAPTTELIAT